MAQTPIITTTFPDVLDVSFRKIFNDKFKTHPVTYTEVLQQESSDRASEKYSSVGNFDYPSLATEHGAPEQDGLIQGYDATLQNDKYMKQAIVTREMIDDDQFAVFKKIPSKLARVFRQQPDHNVAQMFRRGFVATNEAGGTMVAADAVRHFSTIHKQNSEDATTLSNASATSITFTEQNLETALIAANQQLDDRGNLMMVRPNILLVPTALRKAALIITGSDKRPDTADNDLNVYKGGVESYYGGKLKVVVWPELDAVVTGGSDTAWFLLDASLHEMIFQNRMGVELMPVEYNNKNDSWEYTGVMRYAFGMIDWRGTWASKGDGAAYSS